MSKAFSDVWKRPGYREKMSEMHKKLWKDKGPTHKYQLVGDKHPQYKKKITYRSLHLWLYKKFGKPVKCEGLECTKKSRYYVYALIHGKEYERIKENYKQLCMSCHIKYDMTSEWKEKLKNNWKK